MKKVLIILAGVILIVILVFVVIKKESPKEEATTPSPSQIGQQEYFEFSPVRFEDIVNPPKMYGIWPYGIKGENKEAHNEGHPGWDFELKKGSKVYAIADLRIAQIHDGGKQTESGTVQVIEAYAKLRGEDYHIVYHSVVNLESGVVEGAEIKAGEPLAEAGYPLSADTTMIHFGVFPPNDSIGSCPLPYFSEEVQEIINQIVAISKDIKTNKPYSSACVGKIDRDIYLENYPENIEYLGGAEEFE
jgi:hypothetical protein